MKKRRKRRRKASTAVMRYMCLALPADEEDGAAGEEARFHKCSLRACADFSCCVPAWL
jgi:hypothetical protein